MNVKLSFIPRVGLLMLFVAGFVLLLFIANLRSRIYYHGPNYGFLFWIFLFTGVTAVGLIRLRKWAVILLFVPPILNAIIVGMGLKSLRSSPAVPILINLAIPLLLLLVPLLMLRCWRELRW